MDKKLFEKWIKACDELILSYETGHYGASGCPLCMVTSMDCSECLWVKFERIRCHHRNANWGRNNEERIERVNRWKKRLNKMLVKAK